MKKKFCLKYWGLASLIAILLLSACSKDNIDTIVIWTQASDSAPEGKMFRSRVERYNEANPDKIQVEIQNITRAGAGSGYIDKLNAAITSQKLPDIFTLDGPDIAAYVDAALVQPVDELLPVGFTDGFSQAILDQGTVNGKLYGLGYTDSGVAIMYNEDIISLLPEDIQASIPDADSDWSWQDFLKLAQAVKRLKKTNTENPLVSNMETVVSFLLTDIPNGAYEIAAYYLLPIFWSNNTQIVDADGLTVNGYLNGSQAIDSLTVLGTFFAEDLALTTEPDKAFQTGKAAMAVAGFWYINDLVQNYPELKFRTLRYPKMDPAYSGLYTPAGSWAFMMSSQIDVESEKAKQIGELLAWMTNDEASGEYYQKNNSVPARKAKIAAIDTKTDNPYYNEVWEVLSYQLLNTNHARPISVGYPYLSETFARDVVLKVATDKTKEPLVIQEITNKAVEKINKEFEKYKN